MGLDPLSCPQSHVAGVFGGKNEHADGLREVGWGVHIDEQTGFPIEDDIRQRADATSHHRLPHGHRLQGGAT